MTQPARSKVLIVDDSGFMRIALRKMLSAEGAVEVVGEARNGLEAIRMVRELDPDIVTMDIEMPVLDGLDAVRTIMAEMPRPILMVSHLTQDGSAATVRALELGAVDYISKASALSTLDAAQIERELLDKIRYWVRRGRKGLPPRPATLPPLPVAAPVAPAPPARSGKVEPAGSVDLVVIGASTGGPKVMFELLRGLEKPRCPVVVAQHMPAAFTRSFAQHLAEDTRHDVREAATGELANGVIHILPGGSDWVVQRRRVGGDGFTLSRRDQPHLTVHPSVDQLFESAAGAASNPVAVIMTGMGSDGTAGGRRIAERGLPMLVQTPQSCAVDGMTGSAIAAGLATEILAVTAIARRLNGWVGGADGQGSGKGKNNGG